MKAWSYLHYHSCEQKPHLRHNYFSFSTVFFSKLQDNTFLQKMYFVNVLDFMEGMGYITYLDYSRCVKPNVVWSCPRLKTFYRFQPKFHHHHKILTCSYLDISAYHHDKIFPSSEPQVFTHQVAIDSKEDREGETNWRRD